MSSKVPYSPYARTLLHTGRTVWGVILTALALYFFFLTGTTGSGLWVVPFVICAAIGIPLLISGIRAWRKAVAFNEADYAFSLRIHAQLSALAALPHEAVFGSDASCVDIHGARVVELERHFDQETSGAITGSLNHSMSMFGASVSHSRGYISGATETSARTSSSSVSVMRGMIKGVSTVQLGMSSTTRSNLLGDALFSVLEFTGNDGHRDTMRLVSMSAPAAGQWMGDLIHGVSQSLGGPATHAGKAVADWIQPLVNSFAPRDISYATDRLKAMERDKKTTLPTASGQLVGRNAMLATSIEFSGGTTTRLFPHKFPVMFGASIGHAGSDALGLSGPSHPGAIERSQA
ncbi:hypothetical protein AAGW05_04490 [Arthrobacter sp. LAPM80]|uniref:hypothetical protein n=1 Tax=Arthrobacter sp. LAPM80 TaxID=3141788 RepID=UPI00398A5581